MSEDLWTAFRQRETQQRQERMLKEQQSAADRARKKEEAEQQQILRERARIASQQRLEEERRIAEQQSSEKRRATDEERNALLAQSAEQLRQANRRMEEARQALTQKMADEQQVNANESPIEWAFFEEWKLTYPDITLERQYPIGRYRVDFAHISSMTAIELDGHQYHHTRRDRTKDYQRQRYIEDQGWRFVRFTGSEIFGDVASCVAIVEKRIQAR